MLTKDQTQLSEKANQERVAVGAEGGWCRPNPFPGTPYGTGYTWGSGPMC